MVKKKVQRQISTRRFVIAGVITFLIFALGMLLGMVMDYERVQYTENQYFQQELNYRSLQLQFSFLNSVEDEGGNACAAFETAIKDAVSELSDSLEQVEQYQELSKTQRKDFQQIERRYLLDNIRYWLVIRETKDVCPNHRLSILYFYSADDCPTCPDQGVILTYFKKRFGEQLLVFPINVDLASQEPTVEVIQNTFNITSYPSIVVGETPYKGVVSKEELAPIICKGLGLSPEECA